MILVSFNFLYLKSSTPSGCRSVPFIQRTAHRKDFGFSPHKTSALFASI